VRAVFIARDGDAAVVTVQTASDGTCTLIQTRPSADDVDLGTRAADVVGYVAWSWTAGPAGGAGSATVACADGRVTESLEVGR
jgi:hypothetical protein